VRSNILRVIAAYLNCLEHWGYDYRWEMIADSAGEESILIHKDLRTSHVITRSEVRYVQGKPYRFQIDTSKASWRFEVSTDGRDQFFEINPRGPGPLNALTF
jgi:hypothetical protein